MNRIDTRIETCQVYGYNRSMTRLPDTTKTKEMYSIYQDGLSLAKVADKFGVTRQSVYDRFIRQGLPLREKKFQKPISFNGMLYTPDKSGYYRRTTGKQRKWLHQDVWEFHNGDVPYDHVIHHIDMDITNNNITNLSCMTTADHDYLHRGGRTAVDIRYCEKCGKSISKVSRGGNEYGPAQYAKITHCHNCWHNSRSKCQ